MKLNEKIRNLINDRGWTQAKLAQSCGLQPSALSRLLNGDRKWRTEHVISVATALSMTPETLTEGTEINMSFNGGKAGADLVTKLTKAHGSLVAENSRMTNEIESLRRLLKNCEEQNKSLAQQLEESLLALDRETRARVSADSARLNAEERQSTLTHELSLIKAERASLRSKLDASQSQLAAARAAHASAVEVANRNYAIAIDFQQKFATAKGVATVSSILGLAMLIGHVISED